MSRRAIPPQARRKAVARAPRPQADLIVPGVVFGFLGLSWLAWVVGGLLNMLRTGTWREVPVVSAPLLLVRLLEHPGAADRAWPVSVRRGLPADFVTEACLVLVVAAALGAVLGLRSLVRRAGGKAPVARRRARRAGDGSGGSRRGRSRPSRRPRAGVPGWAQPRELKSLRVTRATGERIVLGTHGGRLVAAEARHSVLVVGPTQSGKTSGLAIPAILEWSGPLLATSVKADLLYATADWRRSLGEVRYYDPTGAVRLGPGRTASGWSPLAAAASWSGARRMAAALCSVARSNDGSLEDAGFWYASAEKLLAPLLFAAASAGASMSDVVRWLDDGETTEVLMALELAGVPEALRAARTSLSREERQRASVYATAETVVAAFADPAVARSAERSEIDPAALVAGSADSLYCCAPSRDQERLAPVFTAIVREVLDAAFERAASTGRPLDPPLLVVLDEAANVAPLAELDRVVATAAGHGVQLVTVWQDLAQIESRYGSRWATVVNNHRAKLVCPGIADPVTLQHVSGLLGDEERSEHTVTVGDDGRRSRTEAVATKALAPPGWLRQLPAGEAVLIYGSLPPARVALRPYFSDAVLAARARGARPRTSGYGVGRLRDGTRRARLTAWSPRRS